jgi:hypothetical protein
MKEQSERFATTMFQWLEQVASDASLPPSAFKLAFWIGQRIDKRKGYSWQSQSWLASRTGITVRAVRTSTEQLVGAGHLDVEPHRGRHQTNLYRMVIKGKPDSALDSEDDDGKEEANFRTSDEINRNDASPLLDENRKFDVRKEEVERQKTGSQLPTIHVSIHSPAYAGEMGDTRARALAPGGAALGAGFDEFWRVYPKQIGEDAARRAFDGVVQAGALSHEVIAGAARYAAERRGEDEKFTASPANWLRDGRWKDPPKVRQLQARRSGGKTSLATLALRHGGVA